MIKALGQSQDGKFIIFLGLTKMNIEKLQEGKPIHVDGNEIQVPNMNIGILYGETEEIILKSFEDHGIQINHIKDKKNDNADVIRIDK